MPVKNDTSGTHMSNATMAANVFEVRAVDTVGTGREVMRQAGQNAGGFELRATQEAGSH